jgi:hypothetical protein
MTPSRRGRIATILAGVRPTICLASAPIASTRFDFFSIATTDGSLITMPLPRTLTSVFAVPKSIPTSRENRPSRALIGLNTERSVSSRAMRSLPYNLSIIVYSRELGKALSRGGDLAIAANSELEYNSRTRSWFVSAEGPAFRNGMRRQ